MMTTRNEIVFIDSNLSDYQTLLNGISADAEVHIIDGSSDGLQQMLSFLTGRTNIDAIHVLGHGSSGTLKLGNLTLNSQNIEQYKTQLQQLGQKLTTDGDLLFYGCNVAQGEQGQAFVKQIADFTHADVAASDDLTGATALGGDWRLETHIGSIEAQNLTLDSFASVLVATGGAATIQQGTDTSLIRYDLHNYFQATEFQFTPITLVPIVSADTGSTGADIVFQCKVADGGNVLTVGNWYTWAELQTLVSAAFPSGQATDNGPLDRNSSSSVLDFDIGARIDWNNANLPSTLTFTLGGSRNYTIG
ncbi:MAG: DUF4347 domain-containing protein, partial [Methylococcales bacterium]|nr:DUF4347 domain-containing protein [Methylococcales bacterium]